jgi:hypothetical protein
MCPGRSINVDEQGDDPDSGDGLSGTAVVRPREDFEGGMIGCDGA